MRLCYALIVSSKKEQVLKLVESLNVHDNQIVIHVDAKSEQLYLDLKEEYKCCTNIKILDKRVAVYWGDISTTNAVLSLMREIKNLSFDYVTLLSESCLPLYCDKEIKNFLSRHKGEEFIEMRYDFMKRSRLHLSHPKPYTENERKHRNWLATRDVILDMFFGWILGKNKQFKSWKVPKTILWWTISRDLNNYLVDEIDKNDLTKKYQNTLIPDEHIFAEVLQDSPFANKVYGKGKRGAALMYCNWLVLDGPKSLTMKDYKKIYNNKYPCLYARKFNYIVNKDVVEKIYENRNNESFKCNYK